MEARLAQASGGVPPRIASHRPGRANGRSAVRSATHAVAHTRATDKIVPFNSRRYRDNPLLVQGPGAGPEVTAAGVFADLPGIAESLEVRA
jgi:homoserine dehydrogenase